ncbi:MAG: divalent-cation tolerance protein CutA [Pseudomonadota bacterium]
MSEQAALIMTTVDSDALAERLAERLLGQRLAACIQEVPITSRYRWEGAVQRERETLLLVKTSAAAVEAAIRAIEAEHDYDVPEVIALPVTGGLPGYLRWLVEEADGAASPPGTAPG